MHFPLPVYNWATSLPILVIHPGQNRRACDLRACNSLNFGSALSFGSLVECATMRTITLQELLTISEMLVAESDQSSPYLRSTHTMYWVGYCKARLDQAHVISKFPHIRSLDTIISTRNRSFHNGQSTLVNLAKDVSYGSSSNFQHRSHGNRQTPSTRHFGNCTTQGKWLCVQDPRMAFSSVPNQPSMYLQHNLRYPSGCTRTQRCHCLTRRPLKWRWIGGWHNLYEHFFVKR